jgi:N-glycosidase YbiA
MTIYFYSSKEKDYGCFSNFAAHGFELAGLCWPTNEHYFQAQKFAGTLYAELIRQAPTASLAAKMGRRRSWPLRSDWEQVKDQVMFQGVLRKFETHADIRSVLLATGEELLVENAPRDYYWGYGADGSRQDKLGQVLMRIRSLLRDREMLQSESCSSTDSI